MAMRLMNRVGAMGSAFDRQIAQFMQGPPAAARQELEAAGISIPWGTDFAMVKGSGFCAAAYSKYS